MPAERSALLVLLGALALAGSARAQDAAPVASTSQTSDGEYHTPLAGEPLQTEVFGTKVDVAARDRSAVQAAVLGAELYSPRIGNDRDDFLFALYFLRRWDTRFLRATVSFVQNDVEYAERLGGLELVGRANTFTLPGGRTETIEDDEARFDRIKYGRVLGELGLGYRLATGPGVDNELRADIFYDAAWVYTRRATDTGSFIRLPPDTLEHGLHLRVLYDGMVRNLLELPHSGISAGGDLEVLRRDRWGDAVFTTHTYREEDDRDFLRAAAWVVAATGLPFLSERHRVILALRGGYSPPATLDRFSEFLLGSGPLTTESYDLSRQPIPGLLQDQLHARDYVVGTVEYRFEALFFLYLHLRWTGAFVDHLAGRADGTVHYVRQMGHSLSAAVSSGFVFESSIYAEYAFSTAQLRGRDGHAVQLVITKAF